MEKNEKNKKIKSIFIISTIIAFAGGIFYFVGNLLYDFTLSRKSKGNILEITNKIKSNKKNNEEELNDKNVVKSKTNEEIEIIRNLTDEFLVKNNYEDVYITSFDDLKLRGILYKTNPKSHKWLIVVHGYLGNAEELSATARVATFSKYDLNILTPDLRGHGKSEGDYIGMGWPDRKDILSWVNYILSIDLDAEIVLHGYSMGAATILSLSSDENLPSNIKCIISDCSYSKVVEQFRHNIKKTLHLPYAFPFIPAIALATKNHAGYNIYDAAPVDIVPNSKVPILYIHGGKDNFVPISMAYDLYNNTGSKKELIIFPEAEHANAFFVDNEKYVNVFTTFVNNYIENDNSIV